MGMQDNPLVGDYTKGISKDSVSYFKGLERRARREKVAIGTLESDFQNPLFAMIRGPVDPLGLDRNGKLALPKKAAKPVDKSKKQAKKGAWTTVGMGDLREALSMVRHLRQDQKRNKRR